MSCPSFPCSSSRSGLPPSSHPFISISGGHTNVARIDLMEQALGVFLLQKGRMKDPLKARLIVSVTAKSTPSFNKSLLRLVGAENHSILPRTTHGHQCHSSMPLDLGFLATPKRIQRSSHGLLGQQTETLLICLHDRVLSVDSEVFHIQLSIANNRLDPHARRKQCSVLASLFTSFILTTESIHKPQWRTQMPPLSGSNWSSRVRP